jgi:hypothetical protein
VNEGAEGPGEERGSHAAWRAAFAAVGTLLESDAAPAPSAEGRARRAAELARELGLVARALDAVAVRLDEPGSEGR